jgi:hypothetical protein
VRKLNLLFVTMHFPLLAQLAHLDPRYLLALRQLEVAHATLSSPCRSTGRLSEDLRRAIDEIENVSKEVRHFARLDDQSLGGVPSSDIHLAPGDRLHLASGALSTAKEAISAADRTDPAARAVRDRAVRRIDAAQFDLRQAIVLQSADDPRARANGNTDGESTPRGRSAKANCSDENGQSSTGQNPQ